MSSGFAKILKSKSRIADAQFTSNKT